MSCKLEPENFLTRSSSAGHYAKWLDYTEKNRYKRRVLNCTPKHCISSKVPYLPCCFWSLMLCWLKNSLFTNSSAMSTAGPARSKSNGEFRLDAISTPTLYTWTRSSACEVSVVSTLSILKEVGEYKVKNKPLVNINHLRVFEFGFSI
jgi:hypothetical protein